MSASEDVTPSALLPGRNRRGQTPSTDGSGDETTADRLLRLAAALFREKGYAATTTRELAEHLGVQKASLYHYIRGKEDLLYEISKESLNRITAAVSAAEASASPPGRLEAMIIAHVESALADQDMHTAMLIELRALSADRKRDVLARRDRYQAMLCDALAEGQAVGQLRTDLDAHFLTLSLLNLLNWTIFWFDPGGGLSPHQVAENFATIFIDGARVQRT